MGAAELWPITLVLAFAAGAFCEDWHRRRKVRHWTRTHPGYMAWWSSWIGRSPWRRGDAP